jgi:hypothetical protein
MLGTITTCPCTVPALLHAGLVNAQSALQDVPAAPEGSGGSGQASLAKRQRGSAGELLACNTSCASEYAS